jgi:N-acetylated-alpha-linked acidic dipeptidase
MRAAAAEVVPFKFVPYALALREHIDELRSIHIRRVRKANTDQSAVDPEFTGVPALVEAVRAFRAQAEELDRSTAAISERDQVDGTKLARLNDLLSQVERAFLLQKGLPERPWFKHAIYAPGLTTGYAAWPLPAIRQALEDNDKSRLAGDVPLTVERIKKATAAMESARKHAQAILGGH